MGFFDGIKKSGKKFIERQQEIGRKNQALKKERKEYEADVRKSVLVARRSAFKGEAVKQAKVKAKIDAQRRYNPTPQQHASGGMTAEARSIIYGSGGFGSPTPVKQKVIQKIRQQRSPVKKKKKASRSRSKPKPKTRTIIRYIERPKAKPVDAVADILKRLPQ